MSKLAQNEHYPDLGSDRYETFVGRLGPVFVGDNLLAGDLLSTAIARLSRLAADLQQLELSAFLENVAGWALERSSQKHPVGINPTSGFEGKHPLWSLLLSGFGAPPPLDSVRLLLLWRIVRDKNFDAHGIAKDARTLIQTLERFIPVPVTQHVDRLAAVASDVIKGSAAGSEARALIAQLEKKGIVNREPARALKKLFFFVRQKPTPLVEHIQRRRRQQRAGRQAERGTFFNTVELRPTPRSRELEEFETRELVLAANPAGDETRAAIRNEGEALGRILATQLDYSSHLYLSPDETQSAANWLMKVAREELNTGRLLRAQCCSIWLLSGVTSRSPEQVIDDLTLKSRSRSWKLISPDLQCWRTKVPNAEHFWKPGNDHLKKAVANNRVDQVTLTLPVEVTNLLQLLAHDHSSEPSIEWCDKSELLDECDRLKSSLRRDVCQRFGQIRWQLSTVISAVDETGEPCVGQILGGQRYGLSDAPLHYYSITVSSLREAYANAIYRQFGWRLNSRAAEDGTIGSLIATLNDDVFHSFIQKLRHQIVHEVKTAPRKDRSWRVFNAIVDYTAWMISAATGHRVTHWLEQLTLLDIDPEGWACIADKWTEGIGTLRIVALPPTVIRQINVLRAMAKDLLEDLLTVRGAAAAQARRNIRDRLSGRAPLLFRMAGLEQPTNFSVSQLRNRTLHGSGLPGNIFRARLRMNLTRRGVHSQFVYWQLGHVYLGRDAFTQECLFSVPKFSRLLAAPLEHSITADGWVALPVVAARAAAAPWPEPQGPRKNPEIELLRIKTKFPTQFTHQIRPLDPDAQPVDTERAKAWATKVGEIVLATVRASPDLQPQIDEQATPDDLIAWEVDRMLERSESRQDVQIHLTALRCEVLRLKREEKVALEMPPMVTRLPSPPIGLTPLHVDAARWCSLQRKRWIDTSQHAGEEEALGFLCLLLTTEGQATTVECLLSIVNALAKGEQCVYPDDPDRWMVNIATKAGKVRGLVLSPECVTVAGRWDKMKSESELSVEHICKAINSAITVSAEGDQFSFVLDRLFSIARFGLRVHLPGVICSTFCTEDVRTLSTSRTLEYLGHRIAEPKVPLDSPATAVDTQKPHEPENEPKLKSAHQSVMQLRVLSRKLSALRERGDRQNLDRTRWQKARAAIELVMRDERTTAIMLCIARFATELFAPNREIGVAAAYGRLVSVARRLVDSLGSHDPSQLSPVELEEIYLTVLETDNLSMEDERKSIVAANVLAFHKANAEQLPGSDLSAILGYARERSNSSPRVEAVTAFEFDVLEALQTNLVKGGVVSAVHAGQIHLMQGELYTFGLRIGELLHQRIRDVEVEDERCRIHIRWSTLGTVKSFAARRTFEIASNTNEQLRQRVLDERKRVSGLSVDHNQALLQFVHPASIDSTLRLLRDALMFITGGQVNTPHSFRHTVGSKLILDALSTAASLMPGAHPPSAWSYARQLGHSRPNVAPASYWHLGHLAHARCWIEPTRSADMAAFRGVSTSALRHRRRRSSGKKKTSSAVRQVWSVKTTVETVTRQLSEGSRKQDGTYQLLLSIAEGRPVEEAMQGAACTGKTIKLLCRVLDEIRSECRIEIIQTAALEALIKSVTSEEVTLPIRKTKKLRLSGLQIRAARKITNQSDKWKWDTRQLYPALSAMFAARSPDVGLAAAFVRGVNAQVRKSPVLPIALISASVDQLSRCDEVLNVATKTAGK